MSKRERKPDDPNAHKYKLTRRGRAIQVYREKGIRPFFRVTSRYLYRYVYSRTLMRFRPSKSFTFRNRRYDYFYHKYNFTWDCERTVEVPIIKGMLDSLKGKRVLEVGNVMSHYFSPEWDILDKFEKASGVINQDVVDFSPPQKYDMIFSISTMEHVGYDDDEKDPTLVLKAIENLKKNCLKANGVLIVTMPIGYNKETDRLLFDGKLGLDKKRFMRRISKNNEWAETTAKEIRDITYGKEYPEASAIVIAEM
jgi:hypothetical protein